MPYECTSMGLLVIEASMWLPTLHVMQKLLQSIQIL